MTSTKPMIWIGYTTQYREGGAELALAAETMAAQCRGTRSESVRCEAIESKADFLDCMERVAADGFALQQLHFLGHSGMYGPMFGTVQWPEQFSPHEWRSMTLPFSEDGEAFFHACRTARWFAPFFANTLGVPTHGYHWYTSFSTHPKTFRWRGHSSNKTALYLVGCPGKKSHGWTGSLAKYSGLMPMEKMKRFLPQSDVDDGSYNGVAELYSDVFQDIRVRSDEWAWMKSRLPKSGSFSALDIGCGNGAFLRAVSQTSDLATLERGVGVDRSAKMVELAREHTSHVPQLSFETIESPQLPFPDQSFDVVTSLLSLRYLDWDPIFQEIRRVLRPGGRILIVDMVTDPLRKREWPRLLKDKVRAQLQRWRNKDFQRALKRLVAHPQWHTMLSYNPIRSEHEMKWYLESRFPEGQFEILNLGLYSRVVAFDSGPLTPASHEPLSYP